MPAIASSSHRKLLKQTALALSSVTEQKSPNHGGSLELTEIRKCIWKDWRPLKEHTPEPGIS